MRHYGRRQSIRPRTIVQSFKKVINHAPASRAAATNIEFSIATGVDSTAAGQTGPTDVNVPTGSVIKYFEIQFPCTNLVAVSAFQYLSVQQLRSGQVSVNADVIGGSPQRNQVFFQKLYSIGKEQNSTMIIKFKVPKKFQRVREGDRWVFSTLNTVVHTSAVQIIYKFYR